MPDAARMLTRLTCWWFGCRPIYEAEHHGDGVMPCERCGAPDTTYADRVGDTRHRRAVDALRGLWWHLVLRWLPRRCPACGRRGRCSSDCDGVPF